MDIPLTEFVGFLKQIDSAKLGSREREALGTALPLFGLDDPPPSVEQIRAIARQQFGDAAEGNAFEPVLQTVPNRRFSGGEGLPRQRYYTLSINRAGDDNLTLLAEMRAYRSCRRTGKICTFLDSIYPPGQRLLQAERLEGAGNLLLLVFLDPDSLARTVFVLPYSVSEIAVPRVLDLRRLEAQQWFFTSFYLEQGHIAHFPMPDVPLEDFWGLLPYLMSIEIGGGGYTEGIGRYLRRKGIDGLIYPSSRNDVRAIQENGQLSNWCGWCLVDYRGAETSDSGLIDLGEQTPFTFPAPTRIVASNEGPNRGSWSASGIRQLYRYRYFVELSHFLGEARWRRVADEMLKLEGGVEEFWKFASEYTDPLP